MSRGVLLIRNAYQKDTGGAEQYVYNLALALKNTDYEPIVVTKHRAIIERCSRKNIRTIKGFWYEKQEWDRKYYIRKFYTTLWYVWVILRYRITVVHPQSRDDFVFATNAAKLLRKKVIWTDHADLKYIMDRINHPHPRMQKWILDAAAYATNILCVSKSELELITNVAPEIRSKLRLVYNGVFKSKNIVPHPKDSFVIGTCARLVPAKGISELLEAFASLNYKEARLWLIGGHSGNLKKYQALAKNLGINDRVDFFGYVQNPNDYLANMDIFVHASYHEAFSLAVIEACMLGRPIVATAVGGTPEIITKDTGILIQPKSASKIREAIQKLHDNPSIAAKLGSTAQRVAYDKFDFQKIVEDQIVPIYKGAL